MATLRHIILSRMNIPFKPWKHILNKGWMEHRFEIFDNICYPSMAGQTNKNFTWLMFCDPNTEAKWVKKLASYDKMVPIYCDWPTRMEYINKFTAGYDYIITTRLDNDDALNRMGIENIQNNFNKQDYLFLNYPEVFITDGNNGAISTEPSNPFISLIEKFPAKTVWHVKHGEARGTGRISQINDFRLGLRFIHERNASNRMSPNFGPITEYINLTDFNINWDFIKRN